MKCLLLNYLSYDFTDKKTGNVIQGVNLYVLSPHNANSYTVGNEVSKYSLTPQKFVDLGISKFKVPCVVDLDVSVTPTLRGKAVLNINSIKFVKEVDLLSLCK